LIKNYNKNIKNSYNIIDNYKKMYLNGKINVRKWGKIEIRYKIN